MGEIEAPPLSSGSKAFGALSGELENEGLLAPVRAVAEAMRANFSIVAGITTGNLSSMFDRIVKDLKRARAHGAISILKSLTARPPTKLSSVPAHLFVFALLFGNDLVPRNRSTVVLPRNRDVGRAQALELSNSHTCRYAAEDFV